MEYSPTLKMEVATKRLGSITVTHWPDSGWQIDQFFRDYLLLGAAAHKASELQKRRMPLTREMLSELCKQPVNWSVSRKSDLGDSIMTAIVWSAEEHAKSVLTDDDAIRFTDLGRLRVQECERVVALRTELTKCGAKVIEEGDTLTVYPSKLHGAEIETYNDHRMAMCFAVLGLKVPGIKLRNPSCVKKTFPNFFQKLAAAPPHGLGATVLNARTGEPLEHHDLFAA